MKNSYSTKNCRKPIFYTTDNQIKKYKIIREYLPNLHQINEIPPNINIERDTSTKKELNILSQIWDELDISFQYREAFSIYISYMNDECKTNIIIQEQNNLKRFKRILINLKKEILLREDNLLLLKRYNNRLDNFNNNEQITNIIDEVTTLVKKLRKNAINIIQDYSKIEKLSQNYSNLFLANKKIIKSDYSFDPNYINKMQDDLLFLKESALSKFFKMDNNYIDPFLTNFCTSTKESQKYTIDNPSEIIELINETRYILFRNKIAEKIKINKDNNTIEPMNLKKFSRNFSSKIHRKFENKNNSIEKPEIKYIDKYMNNLKKSSPRKYSKLFLTKKNSLKDIHNVKKQINIFHKLIKPINNDKKLNILNIDIIPKKFEENKNKEIRQYININYYNNDINNLLKNLQEKIPLEKIQKIFKSAFNLDESIYKKDTYLKGVFPKILIITKDEENYGYKNKNNINNIIGLCSYYFEFKEEPKYLKLNINHILSNDTINYEKVITKIINFIKFNEKFDRIEINLINDENGNILINFLKKELKFKWSKVEKNQKDKYQSITLYYEKLKLKDYNDILVLKNKSIINLDNNKISSQVNTTNNSNEKYINKNSIYYSLLENKNIKIEYQDESKFNEIKTLKQKLSAFSEFDINYKIKEDKDIKKNLKENELKEINNEGILYKLNLFINLENCYSLLINNIYYNKISSEQMQIYQIEKTNSIFYFIPTKDSSFILNICEINPELKNLIENNNIKDIYQTFIDFNSNSNKKLQQEKKCLYIPSFVLKKHINSKNLEDINKNIKILDEKTKEPLYISSVNEFINVEFNYDFNIKNNFIENENNLYNDGYMIKNEFIIGIFRNDYINKENKLNLVQILYVEKDNFKKNELL